MLSAFKIVQLMWVISLNAAYGLVAVLAIGEFGLIDWGSLLISITLLTYFIASLLVFFDRVWAWRVCLAMLMVTWFWFFFFLVSFVQLLFAGRGIEDFHMSVLGLLFNFAWTFGAANLLVILAWLRRGEISRIVSRTPG